MKKSSKIEKVDKKGKKKMGKIRQENFGLKLGQILESYKLEKIGQKGKNKIDKNWAKWET